MQHFILIYLLNGETMENIKKNRDLILNKIIDIHKNSSFSKSEIPTLIAVSKKQEDYKLTTLYYVDKNFLEKIVFKRQCKDGKAD